MNPVWTTWWFPLQSLEFFLNIILWDYDSDDIASDPRCSCPTTGTVPWMDTVRIDLYTKSIYINK
jgi:hypothetical protein